MSGTLSAYSSDSDALEMTPNSSRSHCTAAPAVNTLPSRAYCTWPGSVAATVVISPFWLITGSLPVFISRKQPVP